MKQGLEIFVKAIVKLGIRKANDCIIRYV